MFAQADVTCQWLQREEHERADCVELVHIPDDPSNLHFDHSHLEGGKEILSKVKEVDNPKYPGGLRMIICERHRYAPLDFPFRKTTFDTICKKYKLSRRTLETFDLDAGTFTRSFHYDANESITGIDIIIKAPQKREIGNYALSMHYEVNTGTTTALLYGTDILTCEYGNKHRIASVNKASAVKGIPQPVTSTNTDSNTAATSSSTEPESGDEESNQVVPAQNSLVEDDSREPPHLAEKPEEDPARVIVRLVDDKTFFSYICDPSTSTDRKECSFRPKLRDIFRSDNFKSAAKHPLALPCAILEDHLRHTQKHCEHDRVSQENWEIMNKLGMRAEGAETEIFWIDAMKPNYERPVNVKGEKREDETTFDAKKLTARIDRQILRLLFCEQAPRWNRECSQFLLDMAKEFLDPKSKDKHKNESRDTKSTSSASTEHNLPNKMGSPRVTEHLRHSLQHNIAVSQSLSIRLATMKETMNVQLNVCSSITGQTLNESNMKIALQTSQDSTSMKILAFITAIFLPASFIATMFGMDLFQNIWDDGKRWWIYLITALPLTGIVVAGWAIWWKIEISLHDREMQLRDFWRGSKAKIRGQDEFVKPNLRKAERDRKKVTANEDTKSSTNSEIPKASANGSSSPAIGYPVADRKL